MSNDPSNNDLEAFDINLTAHVKEVEDNLDLLSSKDKAFAENLITFFNDHDRLSYKQKFWMCKFWLGIRDSVNHELAGGGIEKLPPVHPGGSPPRVVVIGLPIVQLMDKASTVLQHPKLRYTVAPPLKGITQLVFYRTGEKSHSPGNIGVANGEAYPNNRMLATIYRDKPAAFYPFVFDKPELQQLIKKIAEKPEEHFKNNGQLHGNCCFCGITLTDPRSVEVGYGPICADNWGLPWGIHEEPTSIPKVPAQLNLGVTDLDDDIPF